MRYLFILAIAISCVFTSAIDPDPMIDDIIADDIPYLLDFYKHRHSHPEISLEEKQTSAELATELREAGFEVTEGFGGYGIVGILRNGDGPLILYRTDMDALPMYEKTGLAYASDTEIDYNGIKSGTMHSCGHDMHMTSWLGTARAMVSLRDQWSGTLMLVGQPAEEIGTGARMMLEEGLYTRFGVPDFGLGLHCDPGLGTGKIGLTPGHTMAATEMIDIRVFGVGAHGASPHLSIDPVVLASLMVIDLQTIVSRNLKPTESAVVTVGAIQGGVKHNIIPDEVLLKLTVRTYKEEVRQMIHRRIREICRGVAIAAGLPEDKMPEVIIPENFTPANFNNPDLVGAMQVSAAKAIGPENIIETEPVMIGEDFAMYGSRPGQVPTVLDWLGRVPDERFESGDLPCLHSPFYYPDPEPTLRTAIRVNTQVLLDLMN